MLAAQVEPVRQAVHLHRDAPLQRDLEDRVEVECVLGAVPDEPALRMAQAAHRRVAHRLRHLRRQLRARRALARVQAQLHPVELGEDVVREVERAVGTDVALGAAQHAERRERLVRGSDLLPLAA